jgi:hypothetical protein
MVRLIYGDERFYVPDELSWGLQALIGMLVDRGKPEWLPMPRVVNPLQKTAEIAYPLRVRVS